MRGRAISRAARRTGLPIRNPAPEFMLRHHHSGWVTDIDGELLPVLHQVPLYAGVDLVDLNGDGQHNQTAGAREGFVYLTDEDARETDTPDGEPGFIRAWNTDLGRVHHTLAWQTVTVLPGNELAWKTDTDSYRAWLRKLVQRGRLAPPRTDFVLNMIEDLEVQIAGLTAYGKPAADAEAERIRSRVERLRSQIEQLDEQSAQPPPAPPKPKAVKAAKDT